MHVMRPSNAGAPLQRLAEQEFRDWLRENGDNLADAADLLGGAAWAARASAVVAGLRNGDAVADHKAELHAPRRLLTLDLVTALQGQEARLFACLVNRR